MPWGRMPGGRLPRAALRSRSLMLAHWQAAAAHLTALHAQPAICQGLQVILPVAGGELLQAGQTGARLARWWGRAGLPAAAHACISHAPRRAAIRTPIAAPGSMPRAVREARNMGHCKYGLPVSQPRASARTRVKMSMMFWPNQRCRTLQQKSKWYGLTCAGKEMGRELMQAARMHHACNRACNAQALTDAWAATHQPVASNRHIIFWLGGALGALDCELRSRLRSLLLLRWLQRAWLPGMCHRLPLLLLKLHHSSCSITQRRC